ncbi:MAG: glycerophosphodiester phosphodiesterase [Elusimicrobia bacterium]|nr:glycerophosphodiester phosphodiesterase [Elusimicrobiota bacterium]
MRLIAHRGASGHAPENTEAAFNLALEMGAKAVELDVHQTRDGELVVIHDENLKRTGRRRGAIAKMTFKELLTADVGSWFSPKFKGEGLPTLEEVIDLCEGRAEVHVEIKQGSRLYPGIEEKVVEMVRRREAWRWTVVSSFDHSALYVVRAIDNQVRLGYLLGWTRMPTAYEEMKDLKAESLNLSARQVNAKIVKGCHERGHKVLVYTVNAQKDADRLARIGVDGIFSNFPELRVS